jgi:hypothetical protein
VTTKLVVVTRGAQVYAGPLSGGNYVFGLLNRGSETVTIDGKFAMLETHGLGDSTAACARELFSDKVMKVTGGVTWTVSPHDIAIVRVSPGASSC